jgi:hypothetical protein
MIINKMIEKKYIIWANLEYPKKHDAEASNY